MRSYQLLRNCLFLALMAGAPVLGRTKIVTIPAEYTPPVSAFSEPVNVEGYHFEVNRDATRARVVVEYGYPDELYEISIGYVGGLSATRVQLPGLRWDPEEHAVVYQAGDKETKCAVARGTPGSHFRLRNTGACTVSTTAAILKSDDGWNVRSLKGLDVWLDTK